MSNPVIDRLRGISSWNTFAHSLVTQYNNRGSLSPRQWEAAERMLAKLDANAEAREAGKKDGIDLSRIKALFETAMKSGLKRPKLRLGRVMLSLASQTSRNPGAVYVKDTDTRDYLGKVMDGTFTPSFAGTQANVGDELVALAKDPLAKVVEHGKLSGHCACCGRELTDPESVDRGVGPVCATRWGL